MRQTTAGGTTTYVGELYETDGTTSTKHLYAGAVRIASKSVRARPKRVTTSWYHGDHLGSAHVTTDAAGDGVSLSAYTPFGELAGGVVPESTFAYTGQRFDASPDSYYYHARYYDPVIGRFLSPDPFVQDPRDPQALVTLGRWYAFQGCLRLAVDAWEAP